MLLINENFSLNNQNERNWHTHTQNCETQSVFLHSFFIKPGQLNQQTCCCWSINRLIDQSNRKRKKKIFTYFSRSSSSSWTTMKKIDSFWWSKFSDTLIINYDDDSHSIEFEWSNKKWNEKSKKNPFWPIDQHIRLIEWMNEYRIRLICWIYFLWKQKTNKQTNKRKSLTTFHTKQQQQQNDNNQSSPEASM